MPLYEDEFEAALDATSRWDTDYAGGSLSSLNRTPKRDEEEKKKKSWWDRAGDAYNFVKEGVVDAVNKGKTVATDATDLVQGQLATNKEADVQERVNKIAQEQTDYMRKLSESDYKRPEVKSKLKEYNRRKKEVSNEFTKEDQKKQEQAQDVDAKELAGASAETFLNVATLGIGSIPKQVAQKAGKTLLKEGYESVVSKYGSDVAETLMKEAAKQQAKKTATKEVKKNILRRPIGSRGLVRGAASGATEGAVYSSAAEGYDAIADEATTEEWFDRSVQGLALGAAFGGVLGGAGGALAKRSAGKGKKPATEEPTVESAQDTSAPAQKQLAAGFRPVEQIDEDLTRIQRNEFSDIDNVWKDRVVETKDGQTIDVNAVEAKIADNNSKIRDLEQQAEGGLPPEGVDPSTTNIDSDSRVKALEVSDNLKQQNKALQEELSKAGELVSGTSKEIDPQKVRKLFDDLRTEKSQAEDYKFQMEARDWAVNGDTVQQAQSKLDDLNAGKYTDDMIGPDESVESAVDVFAYQNAPEEVRATASEILDDKGAAEGMLEELMTKSRYDKMQAQMDKAYNKRQAEINEMPAPRQAIEQQKLDEQYTTDLDELAEQLETDAPEVSRYEDIVNHLNSKEEQLVYDVNNMIQEQPDVYRSPSEEMIGQRRQELESNLEKAKKYTDEKVTERILKTDNPVASFKSADPEVKKAAMNKISSDLTDISQIKSAGLSRHIMQYMSPSQFLERMGLRSLHTAVFRGEAMVNQANLKAGEKLTKIRDAMPQNVDASKLMSETIDFLEGKRSVVSEGGEEFAVLVKDLLDEYKIDLEARGYKTRENYFPHYFDTESKSFQNIFKPDTNGNINFKSLKQRTGEGGEYNQDILDVLSQYVSSYNKQKYLEPALKKFDDPEIQNKLDDNDISIIKEFQEQVKGIKADGKVGGSYNAFMDKIFSMNEKTSKYVGQDHYRGHLVTQRQISAMATMGLSPATGLRNTTQMVNTIANIGPRYSMLGAKDFISAIKQGIDGPMFREIKEIGILDGGVSQNWKVDLESAATVRGKYGKAAADTSQVLMSMIRGTDVMLRSQAYFGAKRLALKKGMSEEAAKNFAIERVIDTQFVTSKLDMPPAFNSDGVRSLTQLATFSGKQLGFLKRTVGNTFKKDSNGNYTMQNAKDMGNLLTAVAAAWGAQEMYGELFGMRKSEYVPFYEQIVALGSGLTDDPKPVGDTLFRAPLTTMLVGDGKSKMGLVEALQTQDVGEYFSDNFTIMIPGATQAKRMAEGISTTWSGVSNQRDGIEQIDPTTSGSGNTRFIQGTSPWDKFRGAIFGQYATDEGKQWIREGFPTLTDTEMRLGQSEREAMESGADFKSITPEAQKQFYDFYAAKKKAGSYRKAREAANKAALTGNNNKAIRIAKEYNNGVREAMGSIYSSYDEVPEYLKEQYDDLFMSIDGYME